MKSISFNHRIVDAFFVWGCLVSVCHAYDMYKGPYDSFGCIESHSIVRNLNFGAKLEITQTIEHDSILDAWVRREEMSLELSECSLSNRHMADILTKVDVSRIDTVVIQSEHHGFSDLRFLKKFSSLRKVLIDGSQFRGADLYLLPRQKQIVLLAFDHAVFQPSDYKRLQLFPNLDVVLFEYMTLYPELFDALQDKSLSPFDVLIADCTTNAAFNKKLVEFFKKPTRNIMCQ